ncbi:MAG: insulinase family protein [Chitinophagales bacterium]|nr:insulinase family protein [Chitinophagales bacterium]
MTKLIDLKAPPILEIGKITLPEPKKITLDNGIPMFVFQGAKNDILCVELLFNSGRWTEPSPLTAGSCGRLIKSGTLNKSSFELSEEIDFYGSTIKAGAGYNTFSLQLFTLHRFFNESFPLFQECLFDIAFPETEIDLYKSNALSKHRVELEKNDYVADMAFKKIVFGDQHPYGYETSEERIKAINQTDILEYYRKELRIDNCAIFVSGNVLETHIQAINNLLGKKDWNKSSTGLPVSTAPPSGTIPQQFHQQKKNSVQCSIVIGKQLFNMSHEDYPEFLLMNTIFGGYFGSRLMSNIREDKGYTYGIYSGLQSLKFGGVYSIQTETGLEHKNDCLKEIYTEMSRLRESRVTERELTLARNYLLGKFMGKTDGAFNQVEQFKKYYVEGKSVDLFDNIVEKVRNCNAERIRDLATTYLNKENFSEIVIG